MRTECKSKILAMLIIALSIAITACDGTEPAVVQKPEKSGTAVAEAAVATTAVDGHASPPDYVEVIGDYTLRANAVRSDILPAEMLKQYGIESGDNRGVLNVVVLEQKPEGQEATVAANVTALQSNLMGQSREIDLHAVSANDGTSYLGSFEYSPEDFFRFTITAQPIGTDKILTVEFEERSAVLR